MTVEFRFVGDHVARIGESPVWDAARARLWWVDIVGRRICGAQADGSAFSDWHYDQPVGSIGLSADGGLVAALADGFYAIDGATGASSPIALPPGIAAPVRFNDGKTDRDGRFLAATMTERDMTARNGTLWRLDADGGVERIEQDFVLGNALCFSPDGRTLYFADSVDGTIRRYDYDRATGAVSNRSTLVDCRPHGSGPDGATVDAQGRLWVALVRAQKIGCFAPDGTLVRLLDVPLPFPSCVAFGGPALDTLYVTGISDSGWSLKADGPAAGRILAITGLDAAGIAETPYRHASRGVRQ